MGLETGTYISDLVNTNPAGGDDRSTSDDHHRLIKATILTTFPNITGAVTPTHTELNFVDGVTSAIQTQLNGKEANGVAAALVDDLSGVSDAPTSRTNLGLGALAILATVDTAQIDALAVEAAQIAAAAVLQGKLKTATGTFAGTSSANTKTNFALTGYAFFPMIHCTSMTSRLSGHATDSAAGYDNPRFSIVNSDFWYGGLGKKTDAFRDHSTTGTYDIDYRYIEAS